MIPNKRNRDLVSRGELSVWYKYMKKEAFSLLASPN
jgi:hypothetical protein